MALIQVALRQQFTTTKSIKPYLSLPPPCNKSHPHEANTKKLAPALFLSKNWGKEKRFQKKMRNFVGAFDCIDKLKHALRQPFAQQKQLSTPRIQRLGSRAHNKEKEKNNET